ncbi:hypothetical protein D9619_005285 [Psilocybe cf. subviscida]|uniref:Nephrocystin 3-like N-terminal domain-containing protein n=1 Tax=Psilocybe cf. subviscida TaxID=2480587 RepID=A0A8H5BX07_9AGAR|nr:hypothetical protein D9619_005285 [Psilocybe cf. subviscida]
MSSRNPAKQIGSPGIWVLLFPNSDQTSKKRRSPEARTDNSIPLKDAGHQTSVLVASSASEEARDAHLPLVKSTPPADSAGDAGLKSALTSRRMTAQPIIGPEDPHEPTSPKKTGGQAKERFAVAGRFAQTVIKNLPDLVDGNPVKIAFSVAKLIIETRNSITENHEAINRYMLNAAEKLNAIQAATNNGTQAPQGLEACKNASGATKVFDFENQSKKIEEIFGAIVTATKNFQIQMAESIQTTADRIGLNLKRQALRSLNPVRIAEYDAQISGKYIWRGECTPGTRTDILKDIQDWVEDASPANNICWLTGHAGSGKTAILYTIARRADELAETTTRIDNPRLGATFFCSRQFLETREPDRIIPTIVSQRLAEICQPFEDALQASSISGAYPSLFQTTSISIRTQITGLLVVPWQQCAAKWAQNRYLIVIDALVEIDEQGASDLLLSLFDAIRNHRLGGLKFLVASRTDPNIRKQIESFRFRKEL